MSKKRRKRRRKYNKKKKYKLKIKNVIKLIISVIMLILTIICFVYVNNLNILPGKYLFLFIALLFVLNIISTILLFSKGKIKNIFSIIIYLILALISVIGIKYAGNTLNYLNKGFSHNIEYIVYDIVVLKENTYTNTNDLNNTKMGYLSIDIADTKYLDAIQEKINVELNQLDLNGLYDKLLTKEIDSIIINEGYISMLSEEYEDFNDKTTTLDTIEIEKKSENAEKTIVELKPVNIYLSGSDSRSSTISTTTLSDVNMVITINPNTHEVLLTSIPRDYYVQLHDTTGYKDKLTHAGLYGINTSVETIEDFMNIEIDYYVKVGFQSVIKLVDLVGGVDVYSDISFTTLNGDGGAKRVYIKKGMNHLNGAQALSYARERFAYNNGDIHRTQNQQQIISAILDKITTDKSILLKYDSLLDSFSKLYKTNIPKELITLLIKHQLESMPSWNLTSQTLNGYDDSQPTYSWPNLNLYVMAPDYDSVEKATAKIKETINMTPVEE